MVYRKEKHEFPPQPTEYEGKPIVARLIAEEQDIEYISETKVSLSLKKSFFEQFIKGAYVDLIFLNDGPLDLTVFRYKMISESASAINMRLVCRC